MTTLPEKPCAVCGRRMVWRRRWARSWNEVTVCSDACRVKRRPDDAAALEAALLQAVSARGAGKTICPSEVLPAAEKQDPARMEAVRAAARRLVARGVVVITQRGQVVDPSTARGPIRVRLA